MECKLCKNIHENTILDSKFQGYVENESYEIYHCNNCGTSFCYPLKTDEKIYNAIYSQSKDVPGYSRYDKYYNEIQLARNPLEYLVHSEDVYRGIADLMNRYNEKQDTRVLEVGCGFGYLTYALKAEGFNVTGIDISSEAINKAKESFGDNYIAQDIFEYSKCNNNVYDVIILTEVIEHITNVLEFIECLMRMLKTSGKLIITTPNNPLEKKIIWNTDLPPVHLWWFSKKSFDYIARVLNVKVSYYDYKFKNPNGTAIQLKLNLNKPRKYILSKEYILSRYYINAKSSNSFRAFIKRKLLLFGRLFFISYQRALFVIFEK